MKRYHDVTQVHFEGDVLHVTIDGQAQTFNLRELSQTLFDAPEKDRQTFEISLAGYGIHWPLLDEDFDDVRFVTNGRRLTQTGIRDLPLCPLRYRFTSARGHALIIPTHLLSCIAQNALRDCL